MVENKKVMAKNILYYMNVNSVNASDICKACGFKQNTFSDWVHAKTYPRIDKIELMADYFHINKSDLVEERHLPKDTTQAKSIREFYKHNPLTDEEWEIIQMYRKVDDRTRKAAYNVLKGGIATSDSSEVV